MKPKKFTFHKVKPFLYSSNAALSAYEIRLAGQVVGKIERSSPVKVRIKVSKAPTDADPAPFKWMLFKKAFGDYEQAISWVRENGEKIQENFSIFLGKP